MRLIAFLLTIIALAGWIAPQARADLEYDVEGYLERGTTLAAIEESGGWAIDVTLDAWWAKTKGTFTVQGGDYPLDLDFDEIFQNFDVAGVLHFKMSKGKFGFFLDGFYVQQNGDDGGVLVELEQYAIELAFVYRAVEHELDADNRLMIDVFIGARYNYVKLAGEEPPDPRVSDSGDWFDPMLGAEFLWGWLERWQFELRFDIGGFGVGSQLAWNMVAGVRIFLSPKFSIHFAYRMFDVRYESGSGPGRFEFSSLQQGPYLGVGIHF